VKQAITKTQGRAICYLDPKSELYTWIMEDSSHDPTVEVVNGDTIKMRMGIGGYNATLGNAYRKPMVGYIPFDFVNTNGTLSVIHVGHEITKILKEEAHQTDPKNISRAILMFHIRNVKDFGLEGIQGSEVDIDSPKGLASGIQELKSVPGHKKRVR